MIVAVTYLFHDHEPRMYIVDTEKLDTFNEFETDFKKALEGKDKKVQLDGEKYNDNWGDWMTKCLVEEGEKTINQSRLVHVFFDC